MSIFRVKALSFAAVLMWVSAGSAVAARFSADADEAGLNVIQTEPVGFPNGMLMQGVHSGKVRMVVSVDADGKLVDHLVVAYTHMAFATAAVQAVKVWAFEPAKVRGLARASRADLTFEFKADLVVTVQNSTESFLQDLFGQLYKFQPSVLRELDHIPVPLHVVSPAIPDGVLKEGEVRVVVVEFYIDQEGKVRVPSVSREQVDDHLAAVAVAAVEQWRFEPPMRNKNPVLVLAQQEFRFMAKAN